MLALCLGRGDLRAFEGFENATPDAGRVLNTLETRCIARPLLLSEVAVGRSGRYDKIVIGNLQVPDDDLTLPSLNAGTSWLSAAAAYYDSRL
jgi:hypothetical protein